MSRISSFVRLAAPIALLGLTACAQSFDAKVSRFQAMPAAQGQTFTIKASDPALDGGLEFANYAKLVSGKLTALGYHEAISGEAPNLVVSLGYGVDKGKEKLRSVPTSSYDRCYSYFDPWCGSIGFWGRGYPSRYYGYYPGFYDPYLFGPGAYDSVESYTVFTSQKRCSPASPATRAKPARSPSRRHPKNRNAKPPTCPETGRSYERPVLRLYEPAPIWLHSVNQNSAIHMNARKSKRSQ